VSIQGIIFDLGHTLMHLDGTWPEMFEHGREELIRFLEKHRPEVDAEALAQAWLDRRSDGFARAQDTMREVTAEASMRWVLGQFAIQNPGQELLIGAIDAFFAYEEAHWFADPEAIPVLQTLSDYGLRLGLFSNATHDPLIQRLVDRLGLRPWLDPALSSAATGVRKPDPKAYDLILEAWGLPAAAVVVVGDTLEADVLGAERAGMHSVWLRARQDARQEDTAAPSRTRARATPSAAIGRLGELPTCLLALDQA
jgi:HAD superfamily hydrolase (TIGR01549 family)